MFMCRYRFLLALALFCVASVVATDAAAQCAVMVERMVCADEEGTPPCNNAIERSEHPLVRPGSGLEATNRRISELEDCNCTPFFSNDGVISRLECRCDMDRPHNAMTYHYVDCGAGQAPTFVATADLIVGTWDVDFERSLTSADMSDEERAMATALTGSMQMSITFEATGTMSMQASMLGQTRTEVATYRILSINNDTVEIETVVADVGGKAFATQRSTIRFEDRDFTTFQPGDEQPLYLRRAW